jgi:hypothetical protein
MPRQRASSDVLGFLSTLPSADTQSGSCGATAAEPDFVDPSPGLGDCGQQSIAAFGDDMPMFRDAGVQDRLSERGGPPIGHAPGERHACSALD